VQARPPGRREETSSTPAVATQVSAATTTRSCSPKRAAAPRTRSRPARFQQTSRNGLARPRVAANGQTRPKALVGLTVLCMLFAIVVAAGAWDTLSGGLTCRADKIFRGANINHALGIVTLGGLADSALALCALKWKRLLSPALLIGSAILGIGIAFVAFDSATQVDAESCVSLLGGATPEVRAVHRVAHLYLLWGLPLPVLLLAWASPWARLRLRDRLSARR